MNWYKKANLGAEKIPVNELPAKKHITGWLSPDGEYYDVLLEGHSRFLREVLNIKEDDMPENERLYDLAFRLGWIRLREYEYLGYAEAAGTRMAINHNQDVLKQISDSANVKIEYYFIK